MLCVYVMSVYITDRCAYGVSPSNVCIYMRVLIVYIDIVLVKITRVRSFKRVMAICVVRVVTGRFDVLKS